MTGVVIVGGGIVGCATALFLAEAGVRTTVLEAEEVAAAASGRNAGSVQQPFDELLAPVHRESLAIYQELGILPQSPAGLLAVSRGPAGARAAQGAAAPFPELRPELMEPPEVAALEPELAPGLHGCLLQTCYPARPGEATRQLAALARQAGAEIRVGAMAEPVVRGTRVDGVQVDGQRLAADRVVVAAGPWSREIVRGLGIELPVRALWGVTVEVAPPRALGRRIEEWHEDGKEPTTGDGAQFDITVLDGASVLGATRTWAQPAVGRLAAAVLDRARLFVPMLRDVSPREVRSCARPVSSDGRPLLGPVPGLEGLYLATGHGPYGISLGPASGRMVADELLGRRRVPAGLRPERLLGTASQ